MTDIDGQNILIGLAPIAHEDSRLLILGSMPGKQSLENARYYDHEQNRFWHILFEFFGESYTRDYEARKELLRKGKIALWDSVGSCRRENSSLDSKIRDATGNDISGFLAAHPSIENVITNGRTSEKYFVKFNPDVKYTFLPSTSPANASVKNVRERWLNALSAFLG